MISKKSRKVIAAVLIGATVCASGTFAYFNSKVDMNNISGLNSAQKELAITNGKIVVSGKLANTTGTPVSGWSYDVARVSTIDDATALKNAGALAADFTGMKDGNYDLTALGTTFTSINRSPDLSGGIADSDKVDVSGISRVKLGAQVTGAVTNARPGDAFVLGKDSYEKTSGELTSSSGGIQIINNSNLTTKIGFRLNLSNVDGDTDATQAEQITALGNAGWKVYLRVETPAGVNPTNPYSDWQEFDIEDFLKDGKATTYQVASLAPAATADAETGIKFQVRVELPLITGNHMMDKSTLDGGLTNGLDVTKLFEVVATQENNPGWTQDGTTPADGEAFTDPTTDADRD